MVGLSQLLKHRSYSHLRTLNFFFVLSFIIIIIFIFIIIIIIVIIVIVIIFQHLNKTNEKTKHQKAKAYR